jgi:glycogen synthase
MSSRPRVLWITRQYPPFTGGMAVSAARQVDGLRRRDVRVDVVAYTEPDDHPVLRSEARDNGFDHRVSRRAPLGRTAQLVWNLVKEAHALCPYDWCVGFGAGYPGHVAGTFARWLKCETLVLVRGNDLDEDWFEPNRAFWVRESLDRANVVGAVTRDMVFRIERLFPGKDVRFLANGVDGSRWQLLPRDAATRVEILENPLVQGRTIIGLFGELKFKKGLAYLLSALREGNLLDRVALLIVGNRIDDEACQVLNDPVLAPPRVVHPPVEQDKLPGLYAACDFVALPSLYDGMPNVLLEAMAMGVIPLVSDGGGLKDVVIHGENGFVFSARNREHAAAVMATALAISPAQRESMSRKARDHISLNYSVEAEIDNLRRIFTR